MEHTFLSIDVVQKVYRILHNTVTNIAVVSEINQYQLTVKSYNFQQFQICNTVT
jgi:hypothetical protein